MRSELEEFFLQVEGSESVYCYGAGDLGHLVGMYLNENRIKWDGYVVTAPEQPPCLVNGKPVVGIGSLPKNIYHTFIVGVYPKHQQDIVDVLLKHGERSFFLVDINKIVLLKEWAAHRSLADAQFCADAYAGRFEKAYRSMVCDVSGAWMHYDMFIRYMLDVFVRKRREGNTLYFIGNGGSAGIAMHMTADFLKNGSVRTHSMHDASTLTCLANDYGYEHVFSKQLESLAREGDLLIAVSSSGSSANIVQAIETAHEMGCEALTLSGFDETNTIRGLGDYNLFVPCHEYGIVESLHNMVLQRLVDELHEKPVRRLGNAKRIDFIVNLMTGRVLKIAAALKGSGYQVRAYIDKGEWEGERNLPPSVADVRKGLHEICTEVVFYESESDLFQHLLDTDALVIHHFMAWRDCSLACHIIAYLRDRIPAYVVEHYDVLNDMYTGISQEILMWERYAMEHADGVVYCDCSDIYFNEIRKWQFYGRQMRFFSYNSDIFEATGEDLADDRDLSIVFAGYFESEEDRPDSPWASWLEFAKLCARNHCHLHIYPTTDIGKDSFKGHRRFAEASPYFHLHEAVPFRELPAELSKYDYGLIPGRNIDFAKVRQDFETKEKVIYGGSNKPFDYIAAGLPVIVGWQRLFMQEMADKGMAVMSFNEDIDFADLKRRRNTMRKAVLENRHFFNMSERVEELIGFYHDCANEKSRMGKNV